MSSKKHRKKLRRKHEAKLAAGRAWATKMMEVHAWRQRLVTDTFGPLVELMDKAMVGAVYGEKKP